MRILSRYVFRQALGAVILILLSLTLVTWIAVALRQIDLMTNQGQNAGTFLGLTALALPTLMAFIAPLAVLISSLHVLNRLNGDSELIVMTAGGMPAWRLMYPLMLLALLVTLFVSAINHVVAPWASKELRERIQQVRSDLITQVIQPGRFSQPEPRLTIHIRDRSADGKLLGLLLNDARDPKDIKSYLAETGSIIKRDKAAYLLMQNGHILRQGSATAAADIITFDRYAVDINRFEQRGDGGTELRPREMSTPELSVKAAEPIAPGTSQAGKFASELHDRLSNMFYPFAFVLIAISFAGQAQTTRQNRTNALVLAFAGGVGIRLLGIATANATVIRPSALIWQYGVPLGSCVLSTLIIINNMYPRPQPRFVRSFNDARTRLGQSIGRLVRPLLGRAAPTTTG
jgi:lipopolysaccharide export system permease protein